MSNSKLHTEEVGGTLRIPDQYRAEDSEENRIIYALGQLGEGTAEDIGIKISELDSSIEPGGFSHLAEPILKDWCEKGLISCKKGKDNLDYYFMAKQ